MLSCLNDNCLFDFRYSFHKNERNQIKFSVLFLLKIYYIIDSKAYRYIFSWYFNSRQISLCCFFAFFSCALIWPPLLYPVHTQSQQEHSTTLKVSFLPTFQETPYQKFLHICTLKIKVYQKSHTKMFKCCWNFTEVSWFKCSHYLSSIVVLLLTIERAFI